MFAPAPRPAGVERQHAWNEPRERGFSPGIGEHLEMTAMDPIEITDDGERGRQVGLGGERSAQDGTLLQFLRLESKFHKVPV